MSFSPTLSRRAALTRALAALPGLASAVTFARPSLASPSPSDAALSAIEPRHAAAVATARALDDAAYEVERRARIAAGRRPVWTVVRVSRRKFTRLWDAHVAALRAWEAGKAKAESDYRIVEARAAAEEAKTAVRAVEREIWETPARSLDGLRAKARMAKLEKQLAYSILKDLSEMPAFAEAGK